MAKHLGEWHFTLFMESVSVPFIEGIVHTVSFRLRKIIRATQNGLKIASQHGVPVKDATVKGIQL
jgi:hypothetical protein